jgi:hypothetical protein
MILTVTIRNDQGEALGVLVLNPKAFASGSRGYHGVGKAEIAGKRYQCQAQVVEIGSKAVAPAIEQGE